MSDTDAPEPPAEPDGPAGASGVPTMFDVARRAGVSHQTVSRVLNDLTGVAASTRVRVEQAIAELSYTPSPAARAMAKRRSGSIGLIQAGRPDYGPSNAALGFNEAAHEAGYTVTQASMRSLDGEVLRQAVHRLALQRVEAIVLISGEREGVGVLTGIDAGVPLIVVAVRADAGPAPGVDGPVRRGEDRHRAPDRARATARSATSRVRSIRWMPRSAAAAGRTPCGPTGSMCTSPIVGRLARGIR